MQNTISLLDKYKQACSLASDNACAASLGVTRATISRWRNGLGHPEADSVARMCEASKESLAHWLPLVEAERARTPEARKVWLRLAQAAAAVALTVLAWKHGSDGHALALIAVTPLDIMRTVAVVAVAAGIAYAWTRSPSRHGASRCPASA